MNNALEAAMGDLWFVESLNAARLPGGEPIDSPDLLAQAQRCLWRSSDGLRVRAYASRPRQPPWQRLLCLQDLRGASAGEAAAFHYVVETDIEAGHERDFNAWYSQEHLPGLASVWGTVRAARYLREQGAPRYYACYDLVSADVLGCDAWLAVRATEWSSRVRPWFRNTQRVMFARLR